MTKLQWLEDAGIRALKTVTQTAVGVISGTALFSEVNWMAVLSASALAGITSFLMSFSTFPLSKKTAEAVEESEEQ